MDNLDQPGKDSINLGLLFTEAPQAGRKLNCFEVLGVSPDASDEEIRLAYVRAKGLERPDNNEELDLAFQILAQRTTREAYRKSLLQGHSPEPAGAEASQAPAAEMRAERAGSRSRLDTEKPAPPQGKIRAHATASDEYQRRITELVQNTERVSGQLIREIREACNISLDDLHQATRVGTSFLRALEGKDYAALPEMVYVKGFLRSILKYLNVYQSEFIIQEIAKQIELWKKDPKKI